MTATATCFVCGSALGQPLLDLPPGAAITSLGQVIANTATTVFPCPRCAHVQTTPLAAVRDYYDAHYNMHSASEDEDDLYVFRAGGPVYRSEHQASLVLRIHASLRPGARILDFGCGKSASLRRIARERPDLSVHVYDVSPNYRAFWDDFVPRENQAVHALKPEWDDYFDLVLSFFALEHTQDPRGFVHDLARITRPGGRLHLVFPNMYRNYGDMIVVDHVNHFSRTSIEALFSGCGLNVLSIDTELHNAAHVVVAERSPPPASPPADVARVSESLDEAQTIADFWKRAREKLLAFEAVSATGKCAIYGSGLYGMFIATSLRDAGRVAYFLDQNPHQQAKKPLGKPVIAPAQVGDDIDTVYVALNPRVAQPIIRSVASLHTRERAFFYL